jgi:hypothetical protein
MPHAHHRLPSALRRAGVLALLALAAHTAQATLITFDEQPWHPDEYGDNSWSAYPITTEYDGLGISIFSGYLVPGSPFGTGQSLLGGPSFQIRFTDTLPQYVSLDFAMVSPPGESSVSAFSPSGYSKTFSSGGYSWGGPDIGLVSTPYTVRNHATFYSPTGIAGLDFSTFTQTRIIGSIDNLYFGSVPPIPEPASLALMAAGLGVIGLAARRRRRGPACLRRVACAATLVLAGGVAQAAFVDFEDIPWTGGPDHVWSDIPITNQYAGLGMLVDDGYLDQWYPGTPRNQQYMMGGPFFSVSFAGSLPTHVGLNLSSIGDARASVFAYDALGGLVGQGDTGGWYWGGEDIGLTYDRPYKANSFIALAAPQGISHLYFDIYSSSRITGRVDNIYFGNVAAVPEPASIALLACGLGLFAGALRRQRLRAVTRTR